MSDHAVKQVAISLPLVPRAEVVAEEVAAAARTDEQRGKEPVALDAMAGREAVVGLQVNAAVDADWGEEEAAVRQRVIPVPRHEDAAARRPDVVRRDPEVIRPGS